MTDDPAEREAHMSTQVDPFKIELSLTQVLDRPISGRIFFEEVIRTREANSTDLRPLGHHQRHAGTVPQQDHHRRSDSFVAYRLQRNAHQAVPQRRPRLAHRDHHHQQHTQLLHRQEFAQLAALREIGFQANRRLLQVEQISHDCLLSEEAFQKVNRPIQIASQRASALRFADPQVQALWSALLLFQLLPTGFSNRNLGDNLASLLGLKPADLTQGRMTYQLRRLRLHGMIERIPQTHRYRLTCLGLRSAWFFTYSRILRPGLSRILPQLSTPNSTLLRCFDKLDQEVTSWVQQAKLAA